MTLQLIERRNFGGGRYHGPDTIAVREKGGIYLGADVQKVLGNPDYVTIQVDTDERIIKLNKAGEGDLNKFKLSRWRGGEGAQAGPKRIKEMLPAGEYKATTEPNVFHYNQG